MANYRVSFYKDLLNSSGHNFKCLERQIDVQSDGPSEALIQAEQLTEHDLIDPDCVEVTHMRTQLSVPQRD